MADPKRVDANAGGMGSITDILTLLGGDKSKSTTTSDTSALQGVLNNLQGNQDYSKLLESIFTQAGGQIPGLTASLSNSIGARTGSNSAVTTALGKLLESTALKGQAQIAQQQQNNQQLQVQAANGIAQGNRTTTSSTPGSKVAQAGAALSLGGKFLDSSMGKSLTGKAKSAYDSLFGDSTGGAGANLTPGADAADFASFDSSTLNDFGSTSADLSSVFSDAASGAVSDAFSSGGADAAGDVIGGGSFDIPTEEFGDFFSFADGGLVGRDQKKLAKMMDADKDGSDKEGKKFDTNWEMDEGSFPKSYPTKNPSGEGSQAYADGGRVEPKVGTKGPVKQGGTGGGLSKDSTQAAVAKSSQAASAPITLRFEPGTIPTVEKALKEAGAYADGGIIRSGGGRRSSAVKYKPDEPIASSAVNSPLAVLNGIAGGGSPGSMLSLMQLEDRGGTATSSPGNTAPDAPTAESVAVGNAIGNAVGNATLSAVVGPIGIAAMNAIGINTPQSALSQAINALAGNSGVNPDGTSSTSPTATGTSAVADAMNAEADAAAAASAGDSADGAAGTGSDGSGSDSGGGDRADGGKITGKGTGTSDSINAKVSTGEYISSADVVQKLGVDFFDALQEHFHTPAAIQNAK